MLCASLRTAFGTPAPKRHDFHLQFIEWAKETLADAEKTLKEQVEAAKELSRSADAEQINRQNKLEAAESELVSKSNAAAAAADAVTQAKEAIADANKHQKEVEKIQKKDDLQLAQAA